MRNSHGASLAEPLIKVDPRLKIVVWHGTAVSEGR